MQTKAWSSTGLDPTWQSLPAPHSSANTSSQPPLRLPRAALPLMFEQDPKGEVMFRYKQSIQKETWDFFKALILQLEKKGYVNEFVLNRPKG